MNGDREVLGCAVGDSEDEAFWTTFLRSLRERGLAGVRLVISDHHLGLTKAIATVMLGSAWQRGTTPGRQERPHRRRERCSPGARRPCHVDTEARRRCRRSHPTHPHRPEHRRKGPQPVDHHAEGNPRDRLRGAAQRARALERLQAHDRLRRARQRRRPGRSRCRHASRSALAGSALAGPSPRDQVPHQATQGPHHRHAPTLVESFGIGPDIAGELLVAAGDNTDRIRSEAAFAKLCGACPVPAGSGKTAGRHRLNRGGNRQANAALYRTVIVRMRWHEPTITYVERRTAEGLTKKEIIRCLIG
jgi:hypothetical protein